MLPYSVDSFPQHNTTQHNTTQHTTHNTTQHNTTQHNTTQHNDESEDEDDEDLDEMDVTQSRLHAGFQPMCMFPWFLAWNCWLGWGTHLLTGRVKCTFGRVEVPQTLLIDSVVRVLSLSRPWRSLQCKICGLPFLFAIWSTLKLWSWLFRFAVK